MKTQSRRLVRFSFSLATAATLVLANNAFATKFWKNSVPTGNWAVSNNWSATSAAGVDNGGVPVASEDVNIVNADGVAHTVTYDVNAPNIRLLTINQTAAGATVNTLNIPNNNTLTSQAMFVGGWTGGIGGAATTGRGAVTQANGTVTMAAGTDFVAGHGAGSTGTYTLNGGSFVANQSEFIGFSGTGIFNHSGGTNTLNVNGIGGLTLGAAAGANGTYNLSGAGVLNAHIPAYIGSSGTGNFNQTGGTAHFFSSLNLAYASGSTGNYTLTNSSVVVDGNAYVGGSAVGAGGAAILTVGAGGSMSVAGQLKFFSGDSVLIQGGTLTVGSLFNEFGNLNLFSGTFRVTGPSGLSISTSANPTLPSMSIEANQTLIVDNNINIATGSNINIIGGTVTAAAFDVASGGFVDLNFGVLNVTGAAGLPISNSTNNPFGNSVSPIDLGPTQTINVTNTTTIANGRSLKINGGTFNTGGLSVQDGTFEFNSGTLGISGLQIGNGGPLQGSISIGPEKTMNVTNGVLISTGHHLALDGGTLRTGGLTVNGSFHFAHGLLEITGGTISGLTSLAVPTAGEFRASGVQSLRVAGATGSVITANGNLTLGSASAVNGFGTQGTLQVGANTVTLLDANDVVFDSLSLATLGSGASPGTLNAANGLTLDFGGNITGFGTVSTPSLLAKPLINNGHITGTSAAQRITLPGYVKGVGTFDNVNVTGTFSPGLSPTILQVGNVTFSPTSTLIMELGGTTPGSGYDQLQSTGAVVLGGTLEISFINGFLPTAGQTFNLFDSATLSGTFSSVVLPSVPGLTWDTSQLGSGMLSAVAGLPGDYNSNGAVDAADYVMWRKFNGTSTTMPNDPNPLPIDDDQYNTWRSNFGGSGGAGGGNSEVASSAVPEPGGVLMFVSAMLAQPIVCKVKQRA